MDFRFFVSLFLLLSWRSFWLNQFNRYLKRCLAWQSLLIPSSVFDSSDDVHQGVPFSLSQRRTQHQEQHSVPTRTDSKTRTEVYQPFSLPYLLQAHLFFQNFKGCVFCDFSTLNKPAQMMPPQCQWGRPCGSGRHRHQQCPYTPRPRCSHRLFAKQGPRQSGRAESTHMQTQDPSEGRSPQSVPKWVKNLLTVLEIIDYLTIETKTRTADENIQH